MQRNDILGKIIGIITFLGGVFLLVIVFNLAHSYFSTNVVGQHAVGSTQQATSELGKTAIGILGKIGLLIVMTIAGSIIAARGIQLYFASAGHGKFKPEIIEKAE